MEHTKMFSTGADIVLTNLRVGLGGGTSLNLIRPCYMVENREIMNTIFEPHEKDFEL